MSKQDYESLENMLYRGFLTSEVVVGGVPIVLKTLNRVEYNLLDLHSFSMSDEWEDTASYFLAYSTLFFNHTNVLPNRHEVIPTLAEHYRYMPKSVLVALLVVANRINGKAAECLKQVQGYSYGPRSRQMWQMTKGSNLCDPKITGFTGTDQMGLNMHQRLWTYFNATEDDEVSYLQMYGLAKFVVSPHAPKDVKKMDQKDRKKIRTRDKRRKALFEGRSPNLIQEDNQIKITNETADELLDQMERSIQGGKDYHDLVIEQHRKKIHESYVRRREEEKARREEARRKRMAQYQQELESEIDFDGYTPEEIEHYLRVSDQRRRENRAVAAEHTPVEERERNLIRWGFIDEQDVPETRRHYYREGSETAERGNEIENPLIKDNYERVSNDLNHLRPPRWDDEES